MGKQRLRRQPACGRRNRRTATLTRYAQPPPELARAIATAAARYRIPNGAALLTGIWRNESGSSYPNPYANGLGYGGLFGTRVTAPFGSAQETRQVAVPSTAAQADTAARILAQQINAHNGDVGAALLSYSGGGYSTVPGVATLTSATTTSPDSRPRPGTGAGNQFASWWIGPKPWDGIVSGWNAISGVFNSGWDVLKAFVWLSKPQVWLAVGEFIVGLVIVLLSLRGLFLVLASSGSPVDFETVGGAARSIRDRKVRPAYDQLVPGASNRRRARRDRAGKAARGARLAESFGEVPF